MKKIYLLLLLSLGIGSLCAQNVKADKKDDSKVKVASVSKNPQTTVQQTTIVSKAENDATGTVKEYKKVDGKTVISKDDFDKQSDRGKEHILAHPELYTVEEK